MASIKWCLRQKRGLELTKTSERLAGAYLRKAENSLLAIQTGPTREWKILAAYYALYFSIYAVLMRIGVRCEIHSCTLAFMRHSLKKHFTEDEHSFLEQSMEARIRAHYYVDKEVPDAFYEKLLHLPPEFLEKCRAVIRTLTESEIKDIRAALAGR